MPKLWIPVTQWEPPEGEWLWFWSLTGEWTKDGEYVPGAVLGQFETGCYEGEYDGPAWGADFFTPDGDSIRDVTHWRRLEVPEAPNAENTRTSETDASGS
jgi:hypothetical protein